MSLPPHDPLLNARRTGYARSGFGARYHAHRPKPPAALVDVLRQWGKDQHYVERCTAERLVEFACTIGIVLPVLDLGLSDGELGLTALRDVAERTLGADGLPWYVSYRVRAAVK